MAKIKVENGLQKQQVSVEQAQAYAPFGWVVEKNSECVVHKKNMVTVTRLKEFTANKKLMETEKEYLKAEKSVCKKNPGVFTVLFFLIGIALAVLEFVDVGFKVSQFIDVISFGNWIVVAVGVIIAVLCLLCPTGSPRYGKYKKAKLKRSQMKMRNLAVKASEELQNFKEENRALMTRKERHGFEFETAIERAIIKEKQNDDDEYIPF